MNRLFSDVTRDELRTVFQPSKIVMGIVAVVPGIEYNLLPLCFHMWTSYSPLMYCVAIHCRNYSAELFRHASDFALAIPGETMADQVMYCGTHSGRDTNKAEKCGVRWLSSQTIDTPGIATALANLELTVKKRVETGDHLLVVGEVLSIRLAQPHAERPLLAIGPKTEGLQVLAKSGIHTIGVCPSRDSVL
ncbi:MAG: flavin reductase family protein [Sedimentisphaerales bacterium]|nr:flavin reductase family protein [Sedimentisphaerales bacterium]